MTHITELEILDPIDSSYVDFTDFLNERGMIVTSEDKEKVIESIDGTIYRGRYATKRVLDINCHALNDYDTATVLRILKTKYITVRYLDPEEGSKIIKMFVRKRPAAYRKRTTNGYLWDGMSFTLEER